MEAALPDALPGLLPKLEEKGYTPSCIMGAVSPQTPSNSVYLLELVEGKSRFYVGQTTQTFKRLNDHLSTKRFTRIWVLGFPEADTQRLREIEAFVSRSYPPPLLSRYSSGRGESSLRPPRPRSPEDKARGSARKSEAITRWWDEHERKYVQGLARRKTVPDTEPIRHIVGRVLARDLRSTAARKVWIKLHPGKVPPWVRHPGHAVFPALNEDLLNEFVHP